MADTEHRGREAFEKSQESFFVLDISHHTEHSSVSFLMMSIYAQSLLLPINFCLNSGPDELQIGERTVLTQKGFVTVLQITAASPEDAATVLNCEWLS